MTDQRSLGKYQIVELLGRGATGAVHRAYQRSLGRHVAIKTIAAGPFAAPDFRERFRREARIAASLRHPNIVQIHDIDETASGLPFLVMELVEGHSVADLVRDGRLDEDRALRIAYSVARALKAAHDQGLVHGDVKPANIRVDHQGRVRLVDFGLARWVIPGGQPASELGGTPGYMAPELTGGDVDAVDGRADVYSLGATLYQMLTGRTPFEGSTLIAFLHQAESALPPPPTGLSAAVDAIVQKALAHDPAERFQSAAEMAEALRAVGDDRTSAPVTMPAAPARPKQPGGRAFLRGVAVLGAAGLFAGLAGLSAFALWVPPVEQFAVAVADPPDKDSPDRARADKLHLVCAALSNALRGGVADFDPDTLLPAIEDSLAKRPEPLGWLIRAGVHALGERWDQAETDLRRLAAGAKGTFAPPAELVALHDAAGGPRWQILGAARDLQIKLRRFDAARRTAAAAMSGLSDELSEAERRVVLRAHHVALARSSDDPGQAAEHLETATQLGASADDTKRGPWASAPPAGPPPR
ncbi:MAG: serine/threonine-protein kinase [Planctomycetota bacterium]